MNRLSSFSVILVFVVLMIIGAGVTPLLNIQYTPTQKRNEISISFNWQDASAKVVEMEVTSKIEGIVSAIQGCRNIESHSAKGSGKVTAQFKKGADMEMIRFEIATMIRQIYKNFPDGVSYPALSASSAGDVRESILTFTVNADLPTQEIETYIQDHIIKELALVDGVNSVDLSGATPFYRELSFIPQMLSAYKLNISDIESAIRNSLGEYDIVGSVDNVGILLKHNADIRKLEEIPLKSVEGRIIRIGDVATVLLKEKQPTIYRRINGLNTINIDVYPEKYVNTLEVCAQVKERMTALSQNFPDKFSVIIASDVSVTLKEELNKIYVRTILSLVILLLFVLAVSRSFKYLAVISFALFANIFISFIFYVLFDMEIHLYSLAGITVSLGIIIDTAIVMAAHYGYYKNRSVFIAILAAQLTSIGALVVVFLLPESARANLTDFVGVVIINLVVSLLIAALLIPALVDSTSLQEKKGFSGVANRRYIVKFNRLYAKYIHYGKKYMWVTFVLMFFGFGIPIDKLPTRMDYTKSQGVNGTGTKLDSTIVDLYNKTFGSNFYVNKMKRPMEKVFGGSWRLFNKKNSSSGYYREPARPVLSISASLPDGCTIGQLNEVVKSMENYLSKFDEIDIFRTSISSYKNASIQVHFKKDIEHGYIPLVIKSEVISKAADFGGANWSVSGLDDNRFSNVIGGGYKSERIKLTGYNYEELYRYCQNCAEKLAQNARVKDPEIRGRVSSYSSLSQNEYFIDYDHGKLAHYDLTLQDTYGSLKEQLYMSRLAQYYEDGVKQTVEMVSANASEFDVWNLANEYITIGDKQMRFSDIGHIDKRNSGNEIFRENQQYRLYVVYDYVGTSEQSRRVRNREIKRLNEEVLPIGYKAQEDQGMYGGGASGKSQVLLLLVVIAVIYFVCAVLFESLLFPLIVIGLIPISIIGVFLTFALTGYTFDQGGFASLVMLAGIVVNAGIYLLNEYREQQQYVCESQSAPAASDCSASTSASTTGNSQQAQQVQLTQQVQQVQLTQQALQAQLSQQTQQTQQALQAQLSAHDTVQDVAQDVAQNVAQDVAQNVAQAAAQLAVQDVAQDVAKDADQAAAQAAAQGVAQDVAQNVAQAAAQLAAQDAAQTVAARNTRLYIKAFSHKIIPILLTVLSTVLGLIPFLMDGASEVFWFAFAIGTMGGLLFSLIALVFFMPIWIPMKKRS